MCAEDDESAVCVMDINGQPTIYRPFHQLSSSFNHDEQSRSSDGDDGTLHIDQPEMTTRLYRRRWLIVFLFASYSMTNNYQWIHLSIIGDKILFFYNQSLPDSEYMQQVRHFFFFLLRLLDAVLACERGRGICVSQADGLDGRLVVCLFESDKCHRHCQHDGYLLGLLKANSQANQACYLLVYS